MIARAVAITCFIVLLGGCVFPIPQPPQPPVEPPSPLNAVDRIETDYFVAERIWPSAERAIKVSQTITITLRITAKENLQYVLWREIIGGYAIIDEVGSTSDLEFMVLYISRGSSWEWQYDLTGYRVGTDTMDGVIKAVRGAVAIDARLKASVIVRE